jgi:hypothetical protein
MNNIINGVNNADDFICLKVTNNASVYALGINQNQKFHLNLKTMSRKIKVRKSLGRVTKLEKIERNENIANKLPLLAELPDPPYTREKILLVSTKMSDYYSLHLTGNHEATIIMNETEKILDSYYWDTAEYVEKIANTLNNEVLPVSVGFELYAGKRSKKRKGIFIVETSKPDEVIIKCSRIKGAGAYIAETAIIAGGKTGTFAYAGACTITSISIRNLLPNTICVIQIKGVFNSGEGPVSESIKFRTQE